MMDGDGLVGGPDEIWLLGFDNSLFVIYAHAVINIQTPSAALNCV
jgi:hypothetical protein